MASCMLGTCLILLRSILINSLSKRAGVESASGEEALPLISGGSLEKREDFS